MGGVLSPRARLAAALLSCIATLSCSEPGQTCTLATCTGGVQFELPDAYDLRGDELAAFCDRVSGFVRVDDDVWVFGAGEMRDVSNEMERASFYCGSPAAQVYPNARVVLVLGPRLNTPVELALIDVDGTRLEYEFGTPDYQRSAPNGRDCGPICDIATVELQIAP